MVGAGLRAVGVQRRDAATAGRRRDGARARGVWGGPHARRGTTSARRPVPVPRGRPLRGAANPIHKFNNCVVLAMNYLIHLMLSDHVLDSDLAKKLENLAPIVFLDSQCNSVVKAVHLDILIIKARINLGHQETVAEVSLNILNTVRQVLSRNVNGVSRPARTRD